MLPEVFAIQGRPLVRVSVIDFYGMSNGPTYLESEIAVAGVHEGQHGFFVVTMPVTDGDSCAGGRAAWGYPKVVRRITLERQRNGYVGVVYAPGGRVPELTLSLDASRGESGAEAMDVLRRVGPMPSFTLKAGACYGSAAAALPCTISRGRRRRCGRSGSAKPLSSSRASPPTRSSGSAWGIPSPPTGFGNARATRSRHAEEDEALVAASSAPA